MSSENASGAVRATLGGNIIANVARVGAGLIIPFITFPYVNRVLGPAAVGRINFASSFSSYFVLLATLGIPLYAMRELTKVRGDEAKMKEALRRDVHFESFAHGRFARRLPRRRAGDQEAAAGN